MSKPSERKIWLGAIVIAILGCLFVLYGLEQFITGERIETPWAP